MCTVIYIPSKDGALFSSCRDEDPQRAKAHPPALHTGRTGDLWFPEDAEKGGSWVGTGQKGQVLILLNGAFEAHERRPAYLKSRGLILKDMLDQENPLKYWQVLDLVDIEPFTIVLWSSGQLYELVWDGRIRYTNRKNASVPGIWSSSTLYDRLAKLQRKYWFGYWLTGNTEVTAAALREMLLSYRDPEIGFVMDRGKVKTLSISTIEVDAFGTKFGYYDTDSGKLKMIDTYIKKENEETDCKVADHQD